VVSFVPATLPNGADVAPKKATVLARIVTAHPRRADNVGIPGSALWLPACLLARCVVRR